MDVSSNPPLTVIDSIFCGNYGKTRTSKHLKSYADSTISICKITQIRCTMQERQSACLQNVTCQLRVCVYTRACMYMGNGIYCEYMNMGNGSFSPGRSEPCRQKWKTS